MRFRDAYAMFSCRMTMALYQATKASFGSYIPVERIRRTDPKTSATVVKEYPALPGLIFVPLSVAASFRRQAGEIHNVRGMYTPAGTAHLVDLSELILVQQILNEEFARRTFTYVEEPVVPQVPEEKWFDMGQIVEVVGHPLLPNGTRGEVTKARSDGRVRLRIQAGLNYIEVPKGYLSAVSP